MSVSAPASWNRELERQLGAELERNQRCFKLAEHNGYDVETVTLDHLPGRWWYVPRELRNVAGCQLARVV